MSSLCLSVWEKEQDSAETEAESNTKPRQSNHWIFTRKKALPQLFSVAELAERG